MSYNNLGARISDDNRDHNLWPKRLPLSAKEEKVQLLNFFLQLFLYIEMSSAFDGSLFYTHLYIYKDHLRFIWNISVDASQSPRFFLL